jgi:dUTP pyrophosphatase
MEEKNYIDEKSIPSVQAQAWTELQDTLRYEMRSVKVGIKLLHPDARVPKMQRLGDAAFDLYSVEEVVLQPGDCKSIDCGIACEIPANYKIMVNGRSGLATKGIFCHVGTIDPNYKGMIGTVLINLSKSAYAIKKGDRVGQLSLQTIIPTVFEEVTELSSSVRGDQGFGSSGR